MNMACQHFKLHLVIVSLLLFIYIFPERTRGGKLLQAVQKKEGGTTGGKLIQTIHQKEASTKPAVSISENSAKQFLLKRSKRQLWDMTQPDVQQWYWNFLYMGFDEAKFEDDVSYWRNYVPSSHDHYHRQYYDEDAPVGSFNLQAARHGAGVNYDYY
ncbi:augurin [Protopterus annectens]|uniref:augurin n=1 Tax=Protopterus annectens TaxID=7888 RepID=UPI001CFAFCCC|nr:augurin [Protopterus annectens]